MSGSRVLLSVLAVLLIGLAGCGEPVGQPGQPGAPDGAEAPKPSTTTSVTRTTTSVPTSGQSVTTPEPAPSPIPEDPNAQEPPAPGKESVSIEVAGLPVGSGATLANGDAWCGVFFWGGTLPSGVTLEITGAEVVGEGQGTMLNDGCDGSPPCPGTMISVDTPERGCAVTVRPPSPDTPVVEVRLNGVLHCAEQDICEGLDVRGDSTAVLSNPGGPDVGEGEDPDATDTDESGTEEPGTTTEPSPGR